MISLLPVTFSSSQKENGTIMKGRILRRGGRSSVISDKQEMNQLPLFLEPTESSELRPLHVGSLRLKGGGVP